MSIQLLPAVLIVALTLSSAPARAEDTRADPLSYRFEDELVHGDLLAPTGEILRARVRGRRESLVRVREHWIAELCKSVENL